MNKFKHLTLAATLLCTAAMTTVSCSKDTEDEKTDVKTEQESTVATSQSAENAENKASETGETEKLLAELVESFTANVKDIAVNLNLNTWEVVNMMTEDFATKLFNSATANDKLLTMVRSMLEGNVEAAGEEVAAAGFQYQSTFDLSTFMSANVAFILAKDGKLDFQSVEGLGFGVDIVNEDGSVSRVIITLKGDGEKIKVFNKKFSIPEKSIGVILAVPEKLNFSITYSDEEVKSLEIFNGSINCNVTDPEEHPNQIHSIASGHKCEWHLSGEVTSNIPAATRDGKLADGTAIKFDIVRNLDTKKYTNKFTYVHNGRNILEIDAANTITDMSNGILTEVMKQKDASILDIIYLVANGASVDDLKITLLDNSVMDLKISDCGKAVALWQECKTARRAYAKQDEIEKYTQELNKLITMSSEYKSLGRQFDMTLETVKFGVDYIPMPAVKLGDTYVPITKLLANQKAIEYALNIVDHSLDHIQKSIIVIRQLIGIVRGISGDENLL